MEEILLSSNQITNLVANTFTGILDQTSNDTLTRKVGTKSRQVPPDDAATVTQRINDFIVPPNLRKLPSSKMKSFINEFGIRLEETVTKETTTMINNEESVVTNVEVVNEWFYCLCSSHCKQIINCKKNTSSASDHLRACHGVEGERSYNMRKKKVSIVDGKLQLNN